MAYTPDEGELLSLQRIIAYENMYLRLFADNHTEDLTDTWTDFTQAVGGGYAQKTLTSGSWTITSAGGADDEAKAAYAKQVFTFTGPLTTNLSIYGFVLIGVTSGKLYRVQIETAFKPTSSGDHYDVMPIILLGSDS